VPGLSGRRIVVRARSGRRQRSWLLYPATLRRHASLRTGQSVNVLAFVAVRLTPGSRPGRRSDQRYLRDECERQCAVICAGWSRHCLRRFRNRSRDFCRRPHPGRPPSRAGARWSGKADRRGRTLLCNSLAGLRRASDGSSRGRRANTAMQRSASPNERQARDILDSHALAVSRLHLFLQCVNAGQGTPRQFLIAGTTAAVPTRGTKAITASLAASEGEP